MVVPSSQPRLPEGLRIYAMGDVHGRLDCLNKLLDKIADDARLYSGRKILIGLGDYIDRGADSAGVIARLMQPLPAGLEGIFLMGNHESCFLDVLQDSSKAANWLRHGGRETLLSYRISVEAGRSTPEKMEQLRQRIVAAFPPDHRAWLHARPVQVSFGDYLFVHAGVNPHMPLDAQAERDFLWSREPFLSHPTPLEKVVVHGHTVSAEVEFLPHRIGVDTGAYASHTLSAVVLEGVQQRLIQT